MDETLVARFDRLERKIRRAMDYSDQLQQEIQDLEVIQQAAATMGSLEFIAAQVSEYMHNSNYRAIYDDVGSDPFGLKTYAPFSSYDGGAPEDPNADVNRERVTAQREDSGYRGPGEKT